MDKKQFHRYREKTDGYQKRGGWGQAKWVKGVKRYKLSVTNKSQRCYIQYSDNSLQQCIAYLKVAKRKS